MSEIIQAYLRKLQQLSPRLDDAALEYFAGGLTLSELPSKHSYIQAGVVQKEVGDVHSGLLRAFYVDDNRNEKTVNFASEGNCASHYTVFGTATPSKFYFRCIEPSTMINIPYRHIRDCCERFPAFERCIRLMVEEAHANLCSCMEGFLFGNAESGYPDFIRINHDLSSRVPLTYLCSYLGVERQSLTRIRQKLAYR